MKTVFLDVFGNEIRLSDERWCHIAERKEMIDQLDKIEETLLQPDSIVHSNYDEQVLLYYKYYASTPVTNKYLVVIVNFTPTDKFILTSFFTNKIKQGKLYGSDENLV